MKKTLGLILAFAVCLPASSAFIPLKIENDPCVIEILSLDHRTKINVRTFRDVKRTATSFTAVIGDDKQTAISFTDTDKLPLASQVYVAWHNCTKK